MNITKKVNIYSRAGSIDIKSGCAIIKTSSRDYQRSKITRWIAATKSGKRIVTDDTRKSVNKLQVEQMNRENQDQLAKIKI